MDSNPKLLSTPLTPRPLPERSGLLPCGDDWFITWGEDANGNPLDVGRKQRTVSTSLRRALYARDRGCTFPGCHRKRYLDGHHLEHWINGGETKPENMALLCTYHHTLLHQGAFSIVKEADETLRFVTADGRTIPRHGYRREDFVDQARPVLRAGRWKIGPGLAPADITVIVLDANEHRWPIQHSSERGDDRRRQRIAIAKSLDGPDGKGLCWHAGNPRPRPKARASCMVILLII